MIPGQWYIVLDSDEIKTQPVGVTRLGEKLVFWRDDSGRLSCFPDKCVHRGIQLSTGKVYHDHLQCPFHGFEYDASGRVTVIPANGLQAEVPKTFRIMKYPVYEAYGFVWIWWGKPPSVDLKPPRFFDDIDPKIHFVSGRDPWKAHYSRVIENQLDVVHVPFIHSNTIGRRHATLVDGPGVKWLGEDIFYVYPQNRSDDGSPPLKPSEIDLENDRPFKLEFIFPNLWQNYISDRMRVVAAFVPIDGGNTLLYLHFYQSFLTMPLLRSIVDRLSMAFNIYVAHQDRRVVETHQPQPSTLRIGEKLIPGDFPIIEYRRRREELIRAAQSTDW
jgi:phenylpropionate dioxygenase-like ring-hydroxylating dioxygenase large terminal subunit